MISIVVPVYNAASYIEKTIEMVERQTYTDWELLLVDDKSSDNSREVIKDVLRKSQLPATKIHLICKERNEGAAKARNAGISLAKGRYLAFLDADDVWLPDKLEKELAFMEKNNSAFVFTAYEFGDEQAKPTGRIVHVPKNLDFRHALSRTIIFTSTTLFDLEKLDKSLVQMPVMESEDTATWWKILKTGVVANGLNEVTTIYRRPANSLSSNKGKAVKRIWRLYREIAGLNPVSSAYYLVGWAFCATLRRI